MATSSTHAQQSAKPIILARADSRPEVASLAAWCLAQHTDPADQSRTYVLADDADLAAPYLRLRANVAVRPSRSVGEILRRNPDAVFLALDGDILVTPGWLDGLLAAWRDHLRRPSVPAAAPLMPFDKAGRASMSGFLARQWQAFWRQVPTGNEPAYELWLWENILEGTLMEQYARFPKLPYRYDTAASGCIMFDGRLAARLSLAPDARPAQPGRTWPLLAAIDEALNRHDSQVAVAANTVVLRLAQALSITPATIKAHFLGLPPIPRRRHLSLVRTGSFRRIQPQTYLRTLLHAAGE